MNFNHKSAVAAIALFALTTPMMAGAVIKTSQVSEDQIKVSYSASELTTEEGKDQLARQIRKAARKVCGPLNYTKVGSARQVQENRACYAEAVENASHAINGHNITSR